VRSQVVHVDVNLVAQHQARRAVEHAKPLSHIVKCGAEQSGLLAAAAVMTIPAMAAAPSANGRPTNSAATGAEALTNAATIQDGPHSAKIALPSARPAALASTTSGQLRLSLRRFGAASIASLPQKAAKISRRPVVLTLSARGRFT